MTTKALSMHTSPFLSERIETPISPKSSPQRAIIYLCENMKKGWIGIKLRIEKIISFFFSLLSFFIPKKNSENSIKIKNVQRNLKSNLKCFENKGNVLKKNVRFTSDCKSF